ncbi:MAG: amino acid ABC transporter permease [Nocardioidaceae bacterium]
MSATQLFDVPGPRARARHRIAAAIGLAAFGGLLAWVIWRLIAEEVFTVEVFQDFFQSNIFNALGDGLVGTLTAAAAAIALSVVAGALLAIARLSDHAWVRWPATVFVEFFRAVPLLMLIVFLFLAYSTTLGTYWCLVFALMLYNGAVLAEVFRAGIKAVPRGQSEAAYGVGMRKNQVMRLVLLPQAVTIMLPAIISQCVVVLKDTALGVWIAYGDLVFQGKIIAQFIDSNIVTFIFIALIFIAINYSLSRLAIYVERRMARRGHSTVKPAADVDPGRLMDQGSGG